MESQQQPGPHLSNVLNATADTRDSAYFSSNGDHSKHTSTSSYQAHSAYTPPSSSTDKTPSPTNPASNLGPSLISPTSNGMSVASMVSPTNSVDHHMLNKLDQRSKIISSEDSASRRESVDSRMNQGFDNLRLAGSPYASQNQSTTSIQSNLAAQRNPTNGIDRLSSRFSNSYQPNTHRFSTDNNRHSIRTAPTITGPATGAVAHAAEPTKGQAWAFPDEPVQRMPSAARPSGERDERIQSYVGSRRSSMADSVVSGYTQDSRMPPGQRRLEDGMPDHRLSRASSEFQGASHHHHSLQNRQVSDLRDDEGGSPGSNAPYSRTPELRVSHKLAERKRRTEMKDLFEQLRDLMPQERGAKASKWEILTKAISEHTRQSQQIADLHNMLSHQQKELEYLRHESSITRDENARMRQELNAYHGQGTPQSMGGRPSISSQASASHDGYVTDPYARQAGVPRTELPPIRNLPPGPAPGPDSMTGVQYHADPPRSNGYQPRMY